MFRFQHLIQFLFKFLSSSQVLSTDCLPPMFVTTLMVDYSEKKDHNYFRTLKQMPRSGFARILFNGRLACKARASDETTFNKNARDSRLNNHQILDVQINSAL